MSNLEDRGWVAMIFPCSPHTIVMGAVRGSKRLHWTQKAARAEAESWLAELKMGPIRWEVVDDEVVIGRNGDHYVLLRSILLPQTNPPLPVTSRR